MLVIGRVDFRDVIVVSDVGFLESGDSGALLVSVDNGHEKPGPSSKFSHMIIIH